MISYDNLLVFIDGLKKMPRPTGRHTRGGFQVLLPTGKPTNKKKKMRKMHH